MYPSRRPRLRFDPDAVDRHFANRHRFFTRAAAYLFADRVLNEVGRDTHRWAFPRAWLLAGIVLASLLLGAALGWLAATRTQSPPPVVLVITAVVPQATPTLQRPVAPTQPPVHWVPSRGGPR
jgi:hypothetical protein